MAKKTERKPTEPWSTEKPRLLVPVYQDEYDGLGIEVNMSLTEARTRVRQCAGVPVPLRATAGGSMSALANALRNSSPEKRARIMEILAEQAEQANVLDEEQEDSGSEDEE